MHRSFPEYIFLMLIFVLHCNGILVAQSLESFIGHYIYKGLKENNRLNQKAMQVEKSRQAAIESKLQYTPDLQLQARYTIARGGRVIEFPVGDLMNPVYSTLNQMLQQTGQPPLFPDAIENQTFNFYREKEQETKLRLVQPLIIPQLWHYTRIKSTQYEQEQLQYAIAQRQLIKEIKTACYNYLLARSAEKIYAEAEALIDARMKAARHLFENGKLTIQTIYRLESEKKTVEATRLEMHNNALLALQWLNYLVNNPPDEPVTVPEPAIDSLLPAPTLPEYNPASVQNREELLQYDNAIFMANQKVKVEKSTYLPSISAVIDYGLQGEEYRLNRDDDFLLASVMLQWTLFDGLKGKRSIDQSKLDLQILQLSKKDVENQLLLEYENTFRQLENAYQQMAALKTREKSARKSFQLVSRAFDNGAASYIEWLDARYTYTRARLELAMAWYEYKMLEAELEFVTAAFSPDDINTR